MYQSSRVWQYRVKQSESQLYAIYGEYAANTIINNMDTYLYLGGKDKA
ncbi:MAG TPA: hypothetical protein DDY31_07630 [Lachnospiraceae bacterium]|nr:hypothetical protein [Lachnospiraceae bacterium]